MDAGGTDAITTINPFIATLRINIKVQPQDDCYDIVRGLTELLCQQKEIVKRGFKIKTLHGRSGSRDGVIIYIPNENFTPITEMVIDNFKGNYGYNDQHAEPSIMFGIPLVGDDGSGFPSIRVTSNPGERFVTYNYMQAALVSQATIAYIEKYFNGNKDELIKQFQSDYHETYLHFQRHFPICYKATAKKTFGSSVDLNNLAFLGEEKV